MSKPAKSSYKESRPFVNTPKLKIKAIEEEGRIVRFELLLDDVLHVEHVRGNKILAAFKRIEKLTKNL